jgi:SAM-dependent methyltransferase
MLTSKSIELSDYDEIQRGLAAAYYANGACLGAGLPIYIPHAHRMWEYGSALEALHDVPEVKRVLDVGCGHSLLGPAAYFLTGARLHEIDPKPEFAERSKVLKGLIGEDEYGFAAKSLLDMTDALESFFDAVFCISVLEHLPEAVQREAWMKLASMVAPGGLLVVTVDCWDEQAGDPREREMMFTPDKVKRGMAWLVDSGLVLSDVDFELHGPQVNDYTFFRIIARRPHA